MADEKSASLQSTARFSDRVDDYVRYRPDYPAALLDWLQREQGVDSGWRVADIGAGTGISSKLFLDAGYRVTAVEPNAPMRAAAERWLQAYAGFDAVDGGADATGLPDASVDLVAVAQAFHWFDEDAARREFARILRPHGLAAIWWNSRRLTGTRFLEGYEALLLAYGTDYTSVAERYADDARMRAWFGTGFRGAARFEHAQQLDFEALRGRLMSSSYAPKAGHPRHEPMLRALRELFDSCAENGTVSFDYDTRIFAGHLA
ncbi:MULTISPECIES: class I SAM-dependent methyltransferase [unclassified Rhodanobacter]|uniref:class I SAM-dependent methyltransferase n=1 Tax=unclassified Rhodanobacter TaxID=2621553 RepID=UPI001BE01E86|nr:MULTISPECIES: class I SAM-dependent methyltransferase [unclassified Rhodanobacter]MBT2144880.1 methyltransferase domain-containing protein [Rhodanobacter sp. LX-99]MBT2148925.1 methyltransferase domain-containing protein [Rhodanobacter sp. LX-100]